MKKRTLGILIFDDVEVLDFTGPFEVFSVTNEQSNNELFNVLLISVGEKIINAKNSLKVVSDCSFNDVNNLDILLIPGGQGARPLVNNSEFIHWVQSVSKNCELVLSVCTGALILAKAGILNGLKATTHHQAYGELMQLISNTDIIEGDRFVDNGKVITSGGISAGIDMSFHVIDRLFGKEVSNKTAKYMEYRRMVE
jgi:transcriptional regulator GlxA family with amidase domain